MHRFRPPSRDDAGAVLELVIACDVADLGEPDYSLEDLRGEWDEPGFELALDARVVEDEDGRIVGFAAMRPGEVHAHVHPDAEGRGIGAELLAWTEARAVERGHDRHHQEVGERNQRARGLLTAHGYERVRSYLRMSIATDAVGAEPPSPPPGIEPQPVDPEADGPALHAISERAFASVAAHRGATFERFRDEHLRVPPLDLPLSVVASAGGTPVGFAFSAHWADEPRCWVDLLAVDPGAAGRGLGSWLLATVFARCRAAGLRDVMLGVAADNDRAVALYERAGMRVRYRMDAYERAVTPAG